MKRHDIQVLRGVSVLAVILFHFYPEIFSEGYLGVDVFFLISGYLLMPKMLEIGLGKTENLSRFYLHRIARLAPALFTVTLLFSGWIFLLGPLEDQRFTFAQAITAIINLSNIEAFRLSQGNYFSPNPNGMIHTWSLSVEQQLYFVIPLFLSLTRSKRLKLYFIYSTFLVLAAFFLIMTYSRLNLLPFEILNNRNFYYFSPIFRGFEFLLGGIIGLHAAKLKINRKIYLISWFMLTASLVYEVPGELGVPVVLLISCIILKCSTTNFSDKNALVRIGDASYSIYLVHLPIIYLFNYYFSSIHFYHFLFAVLIIFTVSSFSRKYIEITFRDIFLRQSRSSQIKLTIFSTLLTLGLLLILRIGSVNYYWMGTPPILGGTIECDAGDYGNCGEFIEGKKNYLLIGDSHAAALADSFREVFSSTTSNAVVMYGRGCPLQEIDLDMPSTNDPCKTYMRNVYSLLSSFEFTLVVAQRSSLVTSEKDNYLKNLSSALEDMSLLSEKIYVVTPNFEFRNGQSQGNLKDLFAPDACVKISNLNGTPAGDYRFLKNKLVNLGVNFIDTKGIFSENNCYFFKKNGDYLYWDSNHLSQAGANYYKNKFKEILAEK